MHGNVLSTDGVFSLGTTFPTEFITVTTSLFLYGITSALLQSKALVSVHSAVVEGFSVAMVTDHEVIFVYVSFSRIFCSSMLRFAKEPC